MHNDRTDTQLLTISEAAAYLNVSKATIRRWTNDQRLGCVRLGVRGERRFRQTDLLEFVSASSSSKLEAPAEFPPAKSEHYGHRCIIANDPEEEWSAIGPAIIRALHRGAAVLIVNDTDRDRHLRRVLKDNGFDLDDLQRRQAIRCVSIEDSYLLSGEMKWDRAAAYFESAILEAKARGIDEIVIVGNSSWVSRSDIDSPRMDEIEKYEKGLDQIVSRYSGASIICPYTATQVDSHLLVQALASHEVVRVNSG